MTGIKIGQKIRLLRKTNDVTQDKLAAYLGVTPQAVSRWESEICYPDIETLPQIADFFGVDMDELLCYDSVQKESRVKSYLEKAELLLESDKLADCLTLLREAYAEIPSSFEIQLELASVLSEISAVGAASIIIPSPNVTDNHQYKNAKVLSDADAAILLEESNIEEMSLANELRRLTDNEDIAENMRRRIADFMPSTVGKNIYNEIISLTENKNKNKWG
jgi:transcriptional regulator with XRE-family HTH domain